MSDTAEMAETPEEMMEPICLDNASLVDVMIPEQERERDKRQKKEPIEIIAIEEENAPQTSEPPMMENDRSTTQESLLAFFSEKVAPVLSKDCSSCHQYESETKWVLRNDRDQDFKTLVDSTRYNQVEPAQSLFLLKSIGEAGHGGGPVLTSESESFKKLLKFYEMFSRFAD